jgi:hypothetical protein
MMPLIITNTTHSFKVRTFIKSGILFLLSFAFSLSVTAGKKTVRLELREPDVKIYLEGKLLEPGQVDIVVPSDACVTVKAEKTGFLVKSVTFCNKPDIAPPPKSYSLEMERDNAYDSSEMSDLINKDIEIKTHKPEAETWKMMSQIITSYFEDIEVADRESGYLKTSWVVQDFKQNTVRTRMIVKFGSTEPVTYKIKLVSEQSGLPKTGVQSDDHFRRWDRILRKYKGIIYEIQAKLGS